MSKTAAILFHGDAYSTAGPQLMGRNAAGEGFLRGYFAHASVDRFYVQARTEEAAEPFVSQLRAAGRPEPVEIVTPATTAALETPGLLYFPGPTIAGFARRRRLFGDARWSICGVTHTTASETAMDGITAMLTAPVQPWDALICTSRAVKANVFAMLDGEAEYLARRFGATRTPMPQLPVIPLGVHTGDFAFSDAERARARRVLGADADTIVVLYVGRLSFHAKAHPVPMYLALDAAAKRTGKRVMLVDSGWFSGAAIEASYDVAHAALCPSVAGRRLDGRDRDARDVGWAAADIFCSLADNIQETFGLTPVEAMAAGLPVVASDWDGYRDTVRDGIDGILVPTMMPAPGNGDDLIRRFALGVDTYDHYCGRTAAFVSVEIDAATDAFARLFTSPDLRRQMGAAGRARARAEYDWRTIIARYEALWENLAERRAHAPTDGDTDWPARMDPYSAFASYPTSVLSDDCHVGLVDASVEAAMARLKAMIDLKMVGYVRSIMPDDEALTALIAACAPGRSVGEIAAVVRRPDLVRSLVWLAKIGIVRIAAAP